MTSVRVEPVDAVVKHSMGNKENVFCRNRTAPVALSIRQIWWCTFVSLAHLIFEKNLTVLITEMVEGYRRSDVPLPKGTLELMPRGYQVSTELEASDLSLSLSSKRRDKGNKTDQETGGSGLGGER